MSKVKKTWSLSLYLEDAVVTNACRNAPRGGHGSNTTLRRATPPSRPKLTVLFEGLLRVTLTRFPIQLHFNPPLLC